MEVGCLRRGLPGSTAGGEGAPVAGGMSSEPVGISQIGLVARSPEGHAAKGMQIKGHEDLWVEIQAHTFRNWVNEHLRGAGSELVRDLGHDFADGTKLCALVEALQKKKLRTPWIRRPTNQHQFLENVSAALNAIAEDGVKLVNIGEHELLSLTIRPPTQPKLYIGSLTSGHTGFSSIMVVMCSRGLTLGLYPSF